MITAPSRPIRNMMAVDWPGITCLSKVGRGKWLWRCSCGTEFVKIGSRIATSFRQFGKASCGCLATAAKSANGKRNRTHGHSVGADRPLYDVWRQMHRRCEVPACKDFADYGARGVSVCAEWIEVGPFVAWAWASGYAAGKSIDRIENTQGYSPSNCRWTDATTQVRNRRSTRTLTYQGKTLSLSEWSAASGIGYMTLKNRINLGWDAERAMSTPASCGRNQFSERP